MCHFDLCCLSIDIELSTTNDKEECEQLFTVITIILIVCISVVSILLPLQEKTRLGQRLRQIIFKGDPSIQICQYFY